MNRRVSLVSIIIVFMLMAILFASAVTSNTTNAVRKESPLYGIRTQRAIGEKIENIIENIRTKFLGERMFFILSIDGFYRTGTRLWTSMCTQLPTMPGCGTFCTFKCQNNNMIPLWTDSKGNCDTNAKVYCTFMCP